MKILRTTDIITLKQEDLELDFSPLRYDKSLELANASRVEAGNTLVDTAKQTALLIKYSVKDIRGITDYEGNPIPLKAVNGELSEDDVSTAITVLAKTPFIAPLSYISTSATPKAYKGVKLLVNGKELDLGN